MSASISTLPVWKKDSTTCEWLEELAAMARERPECWGQVVVIVNEFNADHLPVKTRYYSRGLACNSDIVGALQVGILEVYDYMKGRP